MAHISVRVILRVIIRELCCQLSFGLISYKVMTVAIAKKDLYRNTGSDEMIFFIG